MNLAHSAQSITWLRGLKDGLQYKIMALVCTGIPLYDASHDVRLLLRKYFKEIFSAYWTFLCGLDSDWWVSLDDPCDEWIPIMLNLDNGSKLTEDILRGACADLGELNRCT